MENRSKFGILRETPWKWLLLWVAAPCMAVIAMWPVGGPSMAGPILFSGVFALIISQQKSPLVKRVGVLLIFGFIAATYITRSFNVSLSNIWRVGEYTGELNYGQAPEYLIAGGLFLLTLAFTVWYAPKTKNFASRDQWMMAIAVVAMLVNIDTFATASVRGSYKASAPAGEAIDSAILQNGINPASTKAANLVVVIVESWGVPANEFDQSVERKIWDPAQWSDKYTVSSGTSKYFGSTTNAELREWCGVWEDHESFDFDSADCLTHEFRDAGFHTVALHSFNREFFGRAEWYPKLGFNEQYFDADLRGRGANFCDGVFAGACDRDVPVQIGDVLRDSPHERNLVYWLTVNAHLPVSGDATLKAAPCDLGTAEWREDYPMLCRSYKVHQQVADAITAEVMREDFPNSDILIVGDHMPPFFPRAIRSRFDSARVPWVFLKSNSSAE